MPKCSRFKGFLLFCTALLLLSVSAFAKKEVYLGGFPFGIKMTTDGVYVSGIGEVESEVGKVSPAKTAGIREGDTVISLNGKKMSSAAEVADVISGSEGKIIECVIKRNGKEIKTNLVPVKNTDGDYKTGLFIKDSASGIGTVTFVDEDGRCFGGLGHGVTDRNTTGILPLGSGSVHTAEILDVIKGEKDNPGELRGIVDHKKAGELLGNTEMGVFGKFARKFNDLKKLEVASSGEIKRGKCSIYSCLKGTTPCELEGEIVEIVDKNAKTKNFIVRLTDKETLAKTGGIVQGMSGSPIVQNGKLVGAVTHVLMRDQTSGYGIFIENMLSGM
ncbi:MAG: SpoIVB peptidase [Ruminococcaceae bacterium]|nr:SpoIVB peptidase [Oscillospiraceae bacterium]